MLAHVVLIVSSGLSGKSAPDALDRAIQQLVKMKKSPILVLGSDGDDIMRVCSMMDSCEMVFDPNGTGPFSPVKAGLHATNAAAFIWHLDRPFPEPEIWHVLESVIRYGQFSTAHMIAFKDDPAHLFVATANGVRHLKARSASDAWPLSRDIEIQTVTTADLKTQ